jgi:putative ABC transport system ATP-binding protein
MKLELRGVSKKYSDHNVEALTEVNLAIASGDFIAICGPSGCGKSTLLNIIGLIDRPSAGSVRFGDEDISTYSDETLTKLRGQRVGFVFQFFNLLSTLTIEENVALPLEIANSTRARGSALKESEVRKKVMETLERVGIGQRAAFYPSQLSGGEMQRAAIARAVIHAPEILVADEPTGNLDSESGKVVLDLLKELNERDGQTIIMATHSAEASGYAGRLLVMRDGRIISGDKLNSVIDNRLDDADSSAASERSPEVRSKPVSGDV